MTTKARVITVVFTMAAAGNLAQVARAADPPSLFLEHLDEFVWTGPSGGSWQTPGNWTQPTGFSGEFPNDPGRMDTVETTIESVEGAAIYGNFGGDRTVNIADNDANPLVGESVTVASLKLGGTGGAVTVDLTASGQSRLIFENYELNDDDTHPPNPNTTPPTPADVLWGFNQGRGLIWSTGTAGASKVNRISAPIQLNDDVDVEGDRDLHIYGTIYEGDNIGATLADSRPSSINNLLSGGKWLYIHGSIEMTKLDQDVQDGTQDRGFGVNTERGIAPSPAGSPLVDPPNVTRQGNVEVLGTLVGDGDFQVGSPQGNLIPLSTVILRGDSRNIPGVGSPVDPPIPEDPDAIVDDDPYDTVDPYYRGRVVLNRVNLVLDNDGALGSGDLKSSNPSNGFGFNMISTDENRNITTQIQMAQWQTVRGASSVPGLEAVGDHSIEFSGNLIQTNTRGWANLLPEGKTLTLSGAQFPLEGSDNSDAYRIYTVDGSGKTVITGGIHNRYFDGVNPGTGHFRVRGTGTVVVDGSGAPIHDVTGDGLVVVDDNEQPISYGTKTTTYSGYTFMEGGNLHFAKLSDVPAGLEILSSGGAVGLDAGVLVPANVAFLQKLNNAANPNYGAAPSTPTTAPFVNQLPGNQAIYNRYDAGGLMLAESEYGSDLDFTSGDLARAANMSLAAREGDSTYTGTITPATTGLVNPNTYQLGGGVGKLTLPNANQLTGARNLLVTNGSEVHLSNTNNYTGTTRIQSRNTTSIESLAVANQSGLEGNTSGGDVFVGNNVMRRATLTVSNLANGGVASGIGSSSNAAENLLIQGSTLKYVGGAQSSDRLFTVGTAGAIVDASGSGALSFSNTGNLGIDIAENRGGFVSDQTVGTVKNTIVGVSTSTLNRFHTDDLVVGMRIRDSHASLPLELEDDLEITAVIDLHAVTVGERDLDTGETAWGGISGVNAGRTMMFGPAPARFLTLTGSNTGNNTLAPLIGNEPTGGLAATAEEIENGFGSVGIRKTGVGKWILSNNNTYSGETNVEAGTLIVNGNQTGSGTTTVSTGATLGGGGSLPGALINQGIVAPGASAGTMTVKGNYLQAAEATLAIEIGGTGAGAFDLLNVLEGTDTGPVEGDYNGDFVVNAADYTVWRDHLGQTFQLLNEDEHASPGIVDQEDYDFWRDNFGNANLSFGVATLSGTINIDLINGFTPANGNSFTILTAPEGLTANNLLLSGESSGFSLIVNPTSLVLQYLGAGGGGIGGGAVPEPASLVLVGIALATAGCIRRRVV